MVLPPQFRDNVSIGAGLWPNSVSCYSNPSTNCDRCASYHYADGNFKRYRSAYGNIALYFANSDYLHNGRRQGHRCNRPR